MKKLATLIFFISFSLFSQAQLVYSVDSIAYAPESFTAGDSIPTANDDIYSSVIPIGFTFNFFDNNYDSIVISCNGLISFNKSLRNGTSPWPISTSIPKNDNAYHNAIFGVYQDLDVTVSSNHSISTKNYGTAPNRKFAISFNNISMFSCPTITATSQIILYEGTNDIEVHVKEKTVCGTWNGGLAILGIQNEDGSAAYWPQGKNATQWTDTNKAWRFSSTGIYIGTNDVSQKDKVTIYPSPANKYIILKGELKNSPTIYSIMGQKMQTLKMESNNRIDISFLPKGMYILNVNNENYKFLKQ